MVAAAALEDVGEGDVVAEVEGVVVLAVFEPVEEAFFVGESLDEVEVGFVVLDAVFADGVGLVVALFD